MNPKGINIYNQIPRGTCKMISPNSLFSALTTNKVIIAARKQKANVAKAFVIKKMNLLKVEAPSFA